MSLEKVLVHKIVNRQYLKIGKTFADKGKEPDALLADLSNVFDGLSQELLIAKLNVYEINLLALFLSYKK